ncbi:AAA family ATPase [Clostridium butyricum]|uniref:Sporulation initiation inhibitor protein Soj n=1 Tax=Clostridium butyricum TaxID=1492 RepID=A0A6N3GU03_CLOBU
MDMTKLEFKNRKTHVVAIGTLKGGVGKTALVVNAASVLAKQGKKVLILDADPQANTTACLGIDETISGYKGVMNLFKDKNIAPGEITQSTNIDNVDVIGSTILLTTMERDFVNIAYAEQQLSKYIKRNQEFFNGYDIILCDTNPSFSKLNQNIFVASNRIICVSDTGIGAFKGLELFDYLLSQLSEESELDLKIDALVVNKYKTGKNLSKEYYEYLQQEELTKDILIKQTIRDSIRVAEAELEQQAVVDYASKSDVASDFINVIKELEEREIF